MPKGEDNHGRNHQEFILSPTEHAQRAYEDGYFIEAIQVLHGYLELQIRQLVFLNRKESGPHESYDLAIDQMYELSLTTAVKVAFIQRIIKKDIRDKIIYFNKTRNNLIHKVFFDSAAKGRFWYSECDFEKAFKVAATLIEDLEVLLHESEL